MGVILILLLIAGGCLLVVHIINETQSAKMGEKEWQEFCKAVNEEDKKKKYCNYMFKCPMCGSNKVMRIGTASRVASVATVGLASSKIGKQYQCDNCKHKW